MLCVTTLHNVRYTNVVRDAGMSERWQGRWQAVALPGIEAPGLSSVGGVADEDSDFVLPTRSTPYAQP